ncbi:hypothetical protein [Streptomyces sp. B1I3]|uniref:hypothetical protein n=1 Tax=Streptomyces sp. B1I3 TaxID=3042264 RepID=UPI00278733B2|nr:hypothetical protein [Streptomyces sp. B1I3]MDQ0793272.1 hypothetical protein [Streptomyces sp. B1I3]
MGWTTVAGTLVGAVIALGSALLIERRRDRRELARDWRSSRKDLYSTYLSTLARARSELWAVARDVDLPAEERSRAARAAFAGCYDLRYQFEVFAPRSVVEPALLYFRRVRDLRDSVGAGLRHGVPEYDLRAEQIADALHRVRDAMRSDMGTDAMA